MAVNDFTKDVIEIIKSIPKGRVLTYGLISKMAGSPRGARQVVRILYSCSKKENLPWHRVVNKDGCISLNKSHGYEEQKFLLELENVVFDENEKIDLNLFLWRSMED